MALPTLLIGYAAGDREYAKNMREYAESYKKGGKIASYDEIILSDGDLEGDIKPRMRMAEVIILVIGERFLNSDSCERARVAALQLKGGKRANVVHVMMSPSVYERENVTILPHETYPISYTDHWGSELAAWEHTAREIEKILRRESAPTIGETVTTVTGKWFKPVLMLFLALLALGLVALAAWWFMSKKERDRAYYQKNIWGDPQIAGDVYNAKFQNGNGEELDTVYAEALVDYYIKHGIEPDRWKIYSKKDGAPADDWALVNFGLGFAYDKSITCLLRNQGAKKNTLVVIHLDKGGKPLLEKNQLVGRTCDVCQGLAMNPSSTPLCNKNHLSNFETLSVHMPTTTQIWAAENDKLVYCERQNATK